MSTNRAVAAPLCMAALWIFAGPLSPCRAQSDDCSAATPIGPGTQTGSTAAATIDGAACGESDISPDVWFRYTAPETCRLRVDLCGSDYDTVLSVHRGCPGDLSSQIICNDDWCSAGSRVALWVLGGQDYYIRVSGWRGASGNYILTLSCETIEEADACAAAAEIRVGNFSGDTAIATPDGSSPCDPAGGSPDVWYKYVPLLNCRLSLETCGSPLDTILSAHSGCPGTAANAIACNDDSTCDNGSALTIDLTRDVPVWIRIAGVGGATGAYVLNVDCDNSGPPGADPVVGELTRMGQYGREGDLVGLSLESVLCNAGDQALDWFHQPDPRHPFATFNLYRLKDGTLEQIGQSWAKHGFSAAQEDFCGFGCIPWSDDTRLGAGCTDVYSPNANANQAFLGPRGEINPWTGAWTFEGSYFDTYDGHALSTIEHRMQVRDADLDPALNAGAEYFAELVLVAHDDADHLNSVGRERVLISGSPGGTWIFDLSQDGTDLGPTLLSWPGATTAVVPQAPTTDGRCYVASKATAQPGGRWRYEYAIYNLDMDRAVQSLSVPVAGDRIVTSLGSHAPRAHGEGVSNDPWTASRGTGDVTWATQPHAANPLANAVRWGCMHTFRFEADAPPAIGSVTLGLFKPGLPALLVASDVTVPSAAACPGDVTGDGRVDLADLATLLVHFGQGSGAQHGDGDLDGDGDVDLADLARVLSSFGETC